jgi:hypothetical protein
MPSSHYHRVEREIGRAWNATYRALQEVGTSPNMDSYHEDLTSILLTLSDIQMELGAQIRPKRRQSHGVITGQV